MFPSGLWYTLVKSFDFGLNCSEGKKKNKQDKFKKIIDYIKMKTKQFNVLIIRSY